MTGPSPSKVWWSFIMVPRSLPVLVDLPGGTVHSFLCWPPAAWIETTCQQSLPVDGCNLPPRENQLLWEMSGRTHKEQSWCSQTLHVLTWWRVLIEPGTLSVFFFTLHATCLKSHVPFLVSSWQFNMPDVLMCHPGSIEKLKLLGAPYWLTDWLNW